MAQSKVLIVEDDEGLREALIDTLALAGYEWLEADCAEDALLKLKSHSVDIVVSDVQMAGMGGLALLRSIKQHWPNLPVLLMTAYANIQDAVSAMKDGAIDYMAKPFAPEVLLNMVSRYAPVKSDDNGDAVVADTKSLNLQAKLLRVLQEREVERLGSRKSIKLDVRVLATSNRDLKQYVQAGHFREDLYYRLNVFPLTWPALCERKDDIEPLANHLIERHCKKLGLPVPSIAPNAITKLLNYPWPGNVRELDNVVQRALILSENGHIQSEHILLEGVDWHDASSLQQAVAGESMAAPQIKPVAEPEVFKPLVQGGGQNSSSQSSGLGGELRDQEFAIILDTLAECQGRRKEMAEKLGISPRTLRYKLAKMRDAGIDIPG